MNERSVSEHAQPSGAPATAKAPVTSDRVAETVKAAVDEMVVAGGAETALQVAVIKDGELVVDAHAGAAGALSAADVSAGTLFFAGSAAKGVLSSLAHVLVARGALDYELRLVEVWPEFGAHGKENVTVRHVLMHQAGVPGLPADITTDQLCEWDYMCAQIADEQPWWTPGSQFGYHAQTFGFLLGETLQRVTGRSLTALLRETLTQPLGIVDELNFGISSELLPRVARQTEPDEPRPQPEPGSPLSRAMPPGANPDATFANRRDVLTSNIPSMGTMTARAAARLYAALLGDIDEVMLLSPRHLAEVARVAFTGTDRVMQMDDVSWALGYSPARPSGARSRSGSTFGMVGTNGSAAYADIDTGLAVALMRNRFSPDFSAITRIDQILADAYPPPPSATGGRPPKRDLS